MWSDEPFTEDFSFCQKASLRRPWLCSSLSFCQVCCSVLGNVCLSFCEARALGSGRGEAWLVCILSLGHLQRWKKAWPHWGDWIGWCEPEKRPLLWRTRATPELALNSPCCSFLFPIFTSCPLLPLIRPRRRIGQWVKRKSGGWPTPCWPAFVQFQWTVTPSLGYRGASVDTSTPAFGVTFHPVCLSGRPPACDLCHPSSWSQGIPSCKPWEKIAKEICANGHSVMCSVLYHE